MSKETRDDDGQRVPDCVVGTPLFDRSAMQDGGDAEPTGARHSQRNADSRGVTARGRALRGDRPRSAAAPRNAERPPTSRPAPPPPHLVLTEDVGVDLRGTCLYYPCAWHDWRAPVQLFLPWVSSFWMVDQCYSDDTIRHHIFPLSRLHLQVVEIHREELALTPELLEAIPDFEARHPFVTTAGFKRPSTNETFSVRWCKNDARAAFRSLAEPIGVFFYRGDSDGEGGSSIPWLSDRGQRRYHRENPGMMAEVLHHLVDGGLIVTDGGNMYPGGVRAEDEPYLELQRFHGDRKIDPAAAQREVASFQDREGRSFRCIGFLDRDGFGWGPTLVWQVRKGVGEVV